MWTLLQTLAWVRWRTQGIDRYFAHPDAVGRWAASKLYSEGSIGAPGLDPLAVTEVCAEAWPTLSEAIRRGDVSAHVLGDDGLRRWGEDEWAAHQFHSDRDALGYNLRFKSDEVMGHFPRQPEDLRRAQNEVLATLIDRMRTSKLEGDTRNSFHRVLAPDMSERIFHSLWKQAAACPSSNRSWGSPGRGKRHG